MICILQFYTKLNNLWGREADGISSLIVKKLQEKSKKYNKQGDFSN